MSTSDWLENFPDLRRLSAEEQQYLTVAASSLVLPPDQILFTAGSLCQQYLLVVDGCVRVQQISRSGREMLLYRIGPGESCILTTACLFSERPYPAMGITEGPVVAVTLSQAEFSQLVGCSEGFRRFVFRSYGERLAELLMLIETVVFTRLDVRLARRLLELAPHQAELCVTHQKLALELGSAREVISRALKNFADQGWIEQHPRQIVIRDRAALKRVIQSED